MYNFTIDTIIHKITMLYVLFVRKSCDLLQLETINVKSETMQSLKIK